MMVPATETLAFTLPVDEGETFVLEVNHGFSRPNTDDPTKLEPYTPNLRRFASVRISSSLAWGYILLPKRELQTNVQIRRLSVLG
jgi:hypothetical protein